MDSSQPPSKTTAGLGPTSGKKTGTNAEGLAPHPARHRTQGALPNMHQSEGERPTHRKKGARDRAGNKEPYSQNNMQKVERKVL